MGKYLLAPDYVQKARLAGFAMQLHKNLPPIGHESVRAEGMGYLEHLLRSFGRVDQGIRAGIGEDGGFTYSYS